MYDFVWPNYGKRITMLDDLRNANKNKNNIPLPQDESEIADPQKKQLFGMTPAQRFLIVLFILIITLILGCSCLWIFGKIQLPFV